MNLGKLLGQRYVFVVLSLYIETDNQIVIIDELIRIRIKDNNNLQLWIIILWLDGL